MPAKKLKTRRGEKRGAKEVYGVPATLRAKGGRTPDIKEAIAVGADTPVAAATMDWLCSDMGLELVDATPVARKYKRSAKSTATCTANKIAKMKIVKSGTGGGRRGDRTNRITGSNVRLGTEMPAAAGPLAPMPKPWDDGDVDSDDCDDDEPGPETP